MNWLGIGALIISALAVYLAVTGRYAQVGQALATIPLTPASATPRQPAQATTPLRDVGLS